jgi:hypothetical protein
MSLQALLFACFVLSSYASLATVRIVWNSTAPNGSQYYGNGVLTGTMLPTPSLAFVMNRHTIQAFSISTGEPTWKAEIDSSPKSTLCSPAYQGCSFTRQANYDEVNRLVISFVVPVNDNTFPQTSSIVAFDGKQNLRYSVSFQAQLWSVAVGGGLIAFWDYGYPRLTIYNSTTGQKISESGSDPDIAAVCNIGWLPALYSAFVNEFDQTILARCGYSIFRYNLQGQLLWKSINTFPQLVGNLKFVSSGTEMLGLFTDSRNNAGDPSWCLLKVSDLSKVWCLPSPSGLDWGGAAITHSGTRAVMLNSGITLHPFGEMAVLNGYDWNKGTQVWTNSGLSTSYQGPVIIIQTPFFSSDDQFGLWVGDKGAFFVFDPVTGAIFDNSTNVPTDVQLKFSFGKYVIFTSDTQLLAASVTKN